ncbi:Hcp family type VI secretion system effector [Paenibacillus montanisoli]|uniref:Hcp family type VI secretion system effector n=1 Tax=Paenibacillus montanisoli TaxID=2081970 RepID=UPI001402D649|nr:type VI secretion system tube protein Hcp [Paenibacillus montanisoli]
MKKLLTAILLACLLALTLSIVPANAAAAAANKGKILLQLDGINGESTLKGYERWIELTGSSFSIVNQGTAAPGAGNGSGKATLSDIYFTKATDASSIPIMMNSLNGVHIPKGKLVYLRTVADGKQVPYMTISLEDIVISSYSFNDTNESVSLRFNKIKWTFWATDAKGKSVPITGGWDLKQNKAA